MHVGNGQDKSELACGSSANSVVQWQNEKFMSLPGSREEASEGTKQLNVTHLRRKTFASFFAEPEAANSAARIETLSNASR